MANVTINNNTEYVELRELCEGEYFFLDGNLYLLVEGISNYCICFNLSNDEEREEIINDKKVLPIPSNRVKIIVDF